MKGGWCGVVQHMRAFSKYTQRRLERTHGGVLNLYTVGVSTFSLFFSIWPLLIFHPLSLSSSLFRFFFSSLLSSLSATMTMINGQVNSLCTHGSDFFVVFSCSMCCLRCVVGCRRCVGCCVGMTVQKKKNVCKFKKMSRERIYLHCGFLNLKNF